LSPEIARLPGVEAAAPFGVTLHVSGTDEGALEKALEPYRRNPFIWKRTEPTLEDAFIHLMGRSEDNFR
jgi:ABC-2 type transport system ATP-binding protein